MKITADTNVLLRFLLNDDRRQAVDAGLGLLRVGGDFADGAIAFEGMALGGSVFVLFDKKVVSSLKKQEHTTQLLS